MFFVNKSKNAFTIIELLLVIAIISIIAISINNIGFLKETINQKSKTFNNKVLTNIETIRNNVLLGRGTNLKLEPMYEAKIEISSTGSGKLDIKYKTGSLSLYTNSNLSITPGRFYSIDKVECLQIDNSLISIITLGTIIIKGTDMSLTGCLPSSRKLKITTNYKGFKESFTINTVNGLVIKNK